MTDPTPNPPLWRVMQMARHGWASVATDAVSAEAVGPIYAAELRAIADWLVSEPDADCVVPDHGLYLRDLLYTEADRAEAGE